MLYNRELFPGRMNKERLDHRNWRSNTIFYIIGYSKNTKMLEKI